MRNMGNKASNAIWNPNEALHPPPTTLGADERDSELEKYIRKKYEQGAFRKDAPQRGGPSRAAPTSLNRARELDGRLPSGTVTGLRSVVGENRRNPELNDIVTRRAPPIPVERDLPALPVGTTGAPPRTRPVRSASSTPAPSIAPATTAPQVVPQSMTNGGNGFNNGLVNLSGGTNATLPYQMSPPSFTQQSNPYNPFSQQPFPNQQQPFHGHLGTGQMSSQNTFSTSPNAAMGILPNHNMSTSAPSSLAMFDPLHSASSQPSQISLAPPSSFQAPAQQHHFAQQPYSNGGIAFSPSSNYAGGMPVQQNFMQQTQNGLSQPQPYGQIPIQTGQPYGQSFQGQWNGGMGQMGTSMNMGYTNGMR